MSPEKRYPIYARDEVFAGLRLLSTPSVRYSMTSAKFSTFTAEVHSSLHPSSPSTLSVNWFTPKLAGENANGKTARCGNTGCIMNSAHLVFLTLHRKEAAWPSGLGRRCCNPEMPGACPPSCH